MLRQDGRRDGMQCCKRAKQLQRVAPASESEKTTQANSEVRTRSRTQPTHRVRRRTLMSRPTTAALPTPAAAAYTKPTRRASASQLPGRSLMAQGKAVSDLAQCTSVSVWHTPLTQEWPRPHGDTESALTPTYAGHSVQYGKSALAAAISATYSGHRSQVQPRSC